MSTGPVQQPQQPAKSGIGSQIGQLLPLIIVIVCLWLGVQAYHFIAARLKVEWVTPTPVKPVDPTPTPKPDVKPVFPSAKVFPAIGTYEGCETDA